MNKTIDSSDSSGGLTQNSEDKGHSRPFPKAQSEKIPDSFAGKTILVAGAAGFIGSWLCEFYLQKGATVIGLDNFITGSQKNVELLEGYPLFQFHKCNIIENLPSLEKEKIDFIFNFASPASPIDFKKIPLEILRVSSEGTYALLKLAQNKGARFLQASTSEVYGDPLIHPQREEYFGNVNSIGPRSCYDEAKRYAEALIMSFREFHHIETRMVRIFNTYGPRMRPNDGRVIPNFVNQALQGSDITVYGDGSQTRSFCFVTDLVEMIHQVMFSDSHLPFNIGNPDEYSVLEMANKIIQSFQSKSKVVFSPLPQDDPLQRKPNVGRVQNLHGFVPQVSLEDGLRKTADYFLGLQNKT